MDIKGVYDSVRGTTGLGLTNTGDKVSEENKAALASVTEPSGKKYSKQELEKEIGSLNKWLSDKQTHVRFQLHDKLGEYYVQIVNDHSNEVIKEIPPKRLLDGVAQMYEMLGLVVDEKK